MLARSRCRCTRHSRDAALFDVPPRYALSAGRAAGRDIKSVLDTHLSLRGLSARWMPSNAMNRPVQARGAVVIEISAGVSIKRASVSLSPFGAGTGRRQERPSGVADLEAMGAERLGPAARGDVHAALAEWVNALTSGTQRILLCAGVIMPLLDLAVRPADVCQESD